MDFWQQVRLCAEDPFLSTTAERDDAFVEYLRRLRDALKEKAIFSNNNLLLILIKKRGG